MSGIIRGVWANGAFFIPCGASVLGRMPVKNLEGRCGLLRDDGTTVGRIDYDEVVWFNPECAAMRMGDSFIFIDEDGEVLEEPFEDTYELFGPYAAGKKNGKWYFVDVKKKAVVKKGYDSISDYTCGYALVKSPDGYGAIDMDGLLIVSPEYEEVFYLGDAKFAVKKIGLYAVADESGFLSDFEYKYIGRYYNGIAKAEKEGKKGYINEKGEWM